MLKGFFNPDFQNRISLDVILQDAFFQSGASFEEAVKQIQESENYQE
ncbi:hypothetical protein pb186bvf_020665 [Paramecium bursaria]